MTESIKPDRYRTLRKLGRRLSGATSEGSFPAVGLTTPYLLVSIFVYALLVGTGRLPRYDGLLFYALCVWVAHAGADLRSIKSLSAFGIPSQTALFVMFLVASTVGGLFSMFWSHGGVVDRQALLGDVIPWSDAGGYLSDATRRNYGLMLAPGARRSIYLVVLSALLRLTRDNVRLVVVGMSVAGSVMGALVASRIAERARPWGTALALIVLYSFVRRHSFSLSTESLGFVFGAAAFLAWFRTSSSESDYVAGAIFLALGLATRMGPVWIAATTVLFFAVRRRWRLSLMVAGVWIVVLGGDALLLSKIREPGVVLGDYGPILYGMLHGEDFTYVTHVHPELSALPPAHQGAAIFAIIGAELVRQPSLALLGPARSLASFLFLPHGLLSLVLYDPDDISLEAHLPVVRLLANMVDTVGVYRVVSYISMLIVACVVTGVFLLGLVRSLRPRTSDSAVRLCEYVLLGTVISSAFTPPWITEGEQLQSSSLPFLVAAAACSLGAVGGQSPHRRDLGWGGGRFAWALLTPVAILLCAFLPARFPRRSPGCPEEIGTSVLFARGMPGVRIDISDSEDGYSMDRVRTNAKFLERHHSDLGEPLLELGAPHMAFEVVFDPCERRTRVVAGHADVLTRWKDRWARAEIESHRGVLRIIRLIDEP